MLIAMSTYHTPVLLDQCLEGLKISPSGTYVDLTFGGGGHSSAILDGLTTGKLYAFDQDEDAKINASEIKSKSFTFIESNFRYFKRYLKMYGIVQVDGILGDLGISSHQIDTPFRGFSTRFDAELDMRMDRNSEETAKGVVNNYSRDELMEIFTRYGEIKNARKIASQIVSSRIMRPLNTVDELKRAIEQFYPKGGEFKFLAKVFQAIRIEVNDELTALKEMLQQSLDILKPGSRLVIISYHSLEDRLVKNFMNSGNFEGELQKDFYGNVTNPLHPITRKPITPTEKEISENKRARSAKMRIAERL